MHGPGRERVILTSVLQLTVMVTWDVAIFLDALKAFFSLSVATGGVMVNVLTWVYQFSSYLLTIFSVIYPSLRWIVFVLWYLIFGVVSVSYVVGNFFFGGVKIFFEYGYHGLLYLPSGLFSITVLIYNTVSSLFINGWIFMKDGVWPVIMRCIIFIISLAVYVMNMIYNTLIILCGYVVGVCTFIVEFIQHTAGPFIGSVFYYLFLGLFDILEYCCSIMMTVLHYVTAAMLRIIHTLPGAIQPLASDVVYYGSDIVAMVISTVFNLLTWMTTVMMKITELLVVTPAFWALLLAAVLLCCLYYYYTKRWTVRVTATPVEVRELTQERNKSRRSDTGQCSSASVVSRDEVDAVRKRERYEEEMLCVVCQSEKKTILLQPCNHLCLCVNCVDPILADNKICPMCRKYVRQWIKVYL